MTNEYWATFSIYDHRRKDLFARALLLFDRVVIPIPTHVMGDLTQKEIDDTLADAEYLAKHDAAVLSQWNPHTFYEWLKINKSPSFDREEISEEISTFHEMATRNWLLQSLDNWNLPESIILSNSHVIGVPIYPSTQDYQTTQTYKKYRRGFYNLISQETEAHSVTLEIVFNKLLIPSKSVSLEKIIKLRDSKQFKDSMLYLRKWQYQTVKELLAEPNEQLISAASLDFEIWIRQYNDAIREANIEKLQTAVTSVLVIGAALATGVNPLVSVLAGLAPTVFSLRKVTEPSWKALSKEQFSPAGVIYTSSKI